MDDLASQFQRCIRRRAGIDPLVPAPLAVLDFLCIHPFTDGNGRVARLLSLLLLYHFDYRVGRYISLERIVEESRDTYYESLERSSRGWHESATTPPWLGYFWGVLLRAYGEFEQRVESCKVPRRIRFARPCLRRPGLSAFRISSTIARGSAATWCATCCGRCARMDCIQVEGRGRGAKWRATGY